MEKKLSAHLFFLFLFLLTAKLFAQQQEYIAGRLFDSQTNEPLVFANIRIKERALGIITNADGSYRIPLKYKDYGDIIEISSMGYETKEIAIEELLLNDLNITTLNPAVFDLDEAVVSAEGKRKRNLNAKQIVQRAIDAIPRNFPSSSFSTIGYYRDYQLKDGSYVNLNEAILEVFDQGFDQLDDGTSETNLFHFALNEDFEQDSLARIAYDYQSYTKTIKKAHLDAHGGNEFRILRIHDAIRNYNVGSFDFVGTLKTDFIKKHFFMRSRDTRVDNEELYSIKFWVFYPNYRANGTIYISKLDFAIYKLEYTMYDDKKRNNSRKKNKHGHIQKVIYDITTDYRKLDNKMYLNYISFHNSFQIRKPPKFVLDSTLVNMPGGYYMLYFNNPVDSLSAVKHKNYDIRFDQQKFKIEEIIVSKDSVKLYGDKSFLKALDNVRGLTSGLINKGRASEVAQMFKVMVKNIRDVDGNLVNEHEIQEYQQFREFFSQRIKPNRNAPTDIIFMDKRKPIFIDQPLSRPENYNDFWMNSPLKETLN
ncbi:carboxypeptidase-like regulatory domain-containing protein [Eudoraea chungangensis]|uniref:carboxypeptidase-like regulatory domain-containing protein n=1 Tax=Eudoraea chungangensis TaxID=1481905 RepID=UPI0023ECEE8C|nr:carboxypeptidase-like regulatory domain-containing protein [Eudoraea chungangensis]